MMAATTADLLDAAEEVLLAASTGDRNRLGHARPTDDPFTAALLSFFARGLFDAITELKISPVAYMASVRANATATYGDLTELPITDTWG